jgi:hypothetical protein
VCDIMGVDITEFRVYHQFTLFEDVEILDMMDMCIGTVLPFVNMTHLGNEKAVILSRCHIVNHMRNWTSLS